MDKAELENKQGLKEAEFLAAYDIGKYERPSVTVDMLVFSLSDSQVFPLQLLMIRRGDHPFLGQWALPGGFVNMDESLDEAATRELKEETGLDNIPMTQLYTWGDVNRDPRTRVIGVSYLALITGTPPDVLGHDDTDEAKWFIVDYRLEKERRTVTDTGYILTRIYRLRLFNETSEVLAKIKVVKTAEGEVVKFTRDIVKNCGLAFDHAKIIAYALEKMEEKNKT